MATSIRKQTEMQTAIKAKAAVSGGKEITEKDRDEAIAEISASIKRSFSKKYLKDWLA